MFGRLSLTREAKAAKSIVQPGNPADVLQPRLIFVLSSRENMEPWKTMKSKYLLRDRWLTLRADTCETPDGVTVDPYYVLEYPDWVHIVALDSDGRVLITRQYRHAVACG